MKKFSRIALAVLTIGLLGSCTKINERIDDLDKRIDGLESNEIASISNQVESIESSISDLNAIRENIQSLVSKAESQSGDIQKLKEADEEIGRLLDGLKDADKALGTRIDELKSYIEGDLTDYAKKEWAEATFSTLEQYKETCELIAGINAKLEGLEGEIAGLSAGLIDLEQDLGDMSDEIDRLAEGLSALDKKLSDSIARCAENIKKWVNHKLEGYYTAAEADAKLSELKAQINAVAKTDKEKAESLEAEILKTKKEIASTKADLTKEYKDAIAKAIKESEGKMSKALTDAITKVNGQINSLAGRVSTLENTVKALSGRVDAIEQMIQSIEFVPEYYGETVKAEYTGDINNTIDFEDLTISYRVSPAAVVEKMFKSTKTPEKYFKLYFKGVRIQTKAGEADNCLTIKKVTQDQFDKGLIRVVVEKDQLNRLPVRNWISDHTTLSVALAAVTGNTDVVSPYTDVKFSEVGDRFEDDYTNLYLQMARLVGSKQQGKEYNPYRVLFNICADDVCAASAEFGKYDEIAALNEFRYKASNSIIYECYTNLYKAIDVCNQFLTKYFTEDYRPIDNVKYPEYAKPESIAAEARVLRAWLHFTLYTGWKNVPIVTTYPAPAKPSNSGEGDILKWCINELDMAIMYLTERMYMSEKEGAYFVRRGFAMALMGKICMYLGDYGKARGLFTEVINCGNYALVPGDRFMDLFHIQGNGCEEKLFELNLERFAGPGYVDNATLPYMGMETKLWGWDSNSFISDPKWGIQYEKCAFSCGIPQLAADTFVKNDGIDSYRIKATFQESDATLYNHPYDNPATWYESDALNNMDLGDRQKSNLIGIKATGMYGHSTFLPNKLIVAKYDINPATRTNSTNFTVMRYAEVLLLCAEACIKTGNAGEAQKYMDMIRQRAGSACFDMPDMNSLKREKQIELWMEGCRWADIMRWEDADAMKTLSNVGKDIPILYDQNTKTPAEPISGRWYTVSTHRAIDRGLKVGFEEKHKLFPYPAEVVKNNPNIKQNPGW